MKGVYIYRYIDIDIGIMRLETDEETLSLQQLICSCGRKLKGREMVGITQIV